MIIKIIYTYVKYFPFCDILVNVSIKGILGFICYNSYNRVTPCRERN